MTAEEYFYQSQFVTSDLLETGDHTLGLNTEVLFKLMGEYASQSCSCVSGKYEERETFEIVGNRALHLFETGEIVFLEQIEEDGRHKYRGKNESWWCHSKDVKRITQSVKDKQ